MNDLVNNFLNQLWEINPKKKIFKIMKFIN